MLQVDVSRAMQFLDKAEVETAKKRAASSFKSLKEKSGAGAEWLGWRRILAKPNDAELEQIDILAQQLRQEVDVFVVCGIGGSYLGAKAIIEALKPAFKTEGEVEVLFAGHNISGQYLAELIAYLEMPKPDGSPKKVAVNVISKSGTTLETALSFRMLRKWMHEQFPDEASDYIVCTTGPDGGVLNTLVEKNGYKKLTIPNDVGGRFSVLTPVGLFPAAMAGVDIQTLFYQAVATYKRLEQKPDELLHYAAVRYAFEKQGKAIDLISSFEPELHGFGQWLQQLLGESEGKEGRGIFPVVAQYSTDLHSLGQFVQQGAPHLIETFIEVKNTSNSITLNDDSSDDGLDYLAGKSFHEINQTALKATRHAHIEGDVPCITVSLDKKNVQHIGEFIYFFELFNAVYCYMLGVNPFNQPGVEDYKKGMYKLLGKQ